MRACTAGNPGRCFASETVPHHAPAGGNLRHCRPGGLRGRSRSPHRCAVRFHDRDRLATPHRPGGRVAQRARPRSLRRAPGCELRYLRRPAHRLRHRPAPGDGPRLDEWSRPPRHLRRGDGASGLRDRPNRPYRPAPFTAPSTTPRSSCSRPHCCLHFSFSNAEWVENPAGAATPATPSPPPCSPSSACSSRGSPTTDSSLPYSCG